MNYILKIKHSLHGVILIILMLGLLSACSSPEEKAEEFYASGLEFLEKGNLAKANIEFRNALQLDRSMTKAIWGQVIVAERQNNLRKVFSLLNTVIANDPNHLEALIKLSRLYLLSGELDKALELNDKCMEINKNDLNVLSVRSAIFLKLEDNDSAVKFANQVLAKDPYHVDSLIVLASMEILSGSPKEAIKYLDKGIQKHEKNIPLHITKVRVLEELSENEAVENIYKKLSGYYPDISAFNYALADFYTKTKQYDLAESEYLKVIASDPNDIKRKHKLIKFISQTRGQNAAEQQLIDFTRNTPNDYEIKFTLVQFYVTTKQYDKAASLLDEIIAKTSGGKNEVKAKGIKASLLMTVGKKSEAETIANELLHQDKGNEDGLIIRAGLDVERNNLDAAIAGLREVLKNNPTSSRAQLLLAKAYNQSGSAELADEQYFNAVKSSNFNATYGIAYSKYLLEKKNAGKAEKILLDIINKRKGTRDVLKQLAQIRISTGDWSGAQEIVDTLNKTGKDKKLADQIQSAIYLGKKDYDENIQLLKQVYRQTPNDVRPLYSLVKTYILSGKAKQAGQFLDSVIEANPNNLSAINLRGHVYIVEGNDSKAIDIYKSALAISPKNTESYYRLALIYLRKNQFDDASSYLDKGIGVSPDNLLFKMLKAQIYQLRNNTDSAIQAYRDILNDNQNADIVANNLASILTDQVDNKAYIDEAYKIAQRFKNSGIPQFKDTFAWASYRVGKFNEAKIALESVIKQMPTSSVVHYHLGMVYVSLGDKAKASTHLNKSLQLAGSGEFEYENDVRKALSNL